LIIGFRLDVDENCALLGYYTASCGNCLPTFYMGMWARGESTSRCRLSFLLGLLTLEDGTDTLSRNVGKVTTRRRVISQKSADVKGSAVCSYLARILL
jgi:hypothetical protein